MIQFTPGLVPKPCARPILGLASQSYVTPAIIDLRSQLLPSSDQGSSSKCVCYAMAGWIEFHRWKYEGIAEQVDPAPLYARAKVIDGLAGEGTSLEAGLQAAEDLGFLKVSSVRSINQLVEVKQALHRYGVVLAAMSVDDGWMRANTDGFIPPGIQPLGGHAILLCGYSDESKQPYVAFQNSWGTNQGWRGFNRLAPDVFSGQFDYGLVWDCLS